MSVYGGSGISRKRIVNSQSQSGGLNSLAEEEGDVWHDKDILFSHHLKEVLDKWEDIDDEIWGKVICMEKNRRVAKAYARVPVLTVNGSEDGFDGYRIGLYGFDNPKRESATLEVMKQVGQGIKLKLDQDGNIFMKKVTQADIIIRDTGNDMTSDSCLSAELVKTQGQLELGKPVKVFDMKRFTLNIAKEMRGPYLNRRKLELQCITTIAFGQTMPNHLESPCWLMLINIVALDMLRNKLPQDIYTLPHSSQMRMPALMENVSATRFFSTPRDEHYPRLAQKQQQLTKNLIDRNNLTAQINGDYVNDFNSRTATLPNMYSSVQSVYGGGFPAQIMQAPYSAQARQPLQTYQFTQKQFPDADYKRWSSHVNLQGLGQEPIKVSQWE